MEGCTWNVLGILGYYVLRDWGVYMWGCTWDVLGIPGYHVLRDWGVLYGGKYLGCPWYPGILCIEGLGGSIWGDVPGMSLVSRDTMTVLRSMEGCTWDVLGILGYNV